MPREISLVVSHLGEKQHILYEADTRQLREASPPAWFRGVCVCVCLLRGERKLFKVCARELQLTLHWTSHNLPILSPFWWWIQAFLSSCYILLFAVALSGWGPMLSNSCSCCCCCSARLGLWFTRRARRGKKWCFHRSPAGNSLVCWVRLWSIWWKLEMWRENKFADSLQAIARFILLVHRCKMGVEGIRKLMKGKRGDSQIHLDHSAMCAV